MKAAAARSVNFRSQPDNLNGVGFRVLGFRGLGSRVLGFRRAHRALLLIGFVVWGFLGQWFGVGGSGGGWRRFTSQTDCRTCAAPRKSNISHKQPKLFLSPAR